MAPERFLLRCTRRTASTPAMCLHERRIGGADVTVRFPRVWLDDWRSGRRRRRSADRGLPPCRGAELTLFGDHAAFEIDVEDRQFKNIGPAALLVLEKQHAEKFIADIGFQ